MADVADGNNIQKTDTIKGMSGHIVFNNTQDDRGLGPERTEDHSYVQLAHTDHAQISLQSGGKVRTDSPSDTSINVGRNKIVNVLGDNQLSVGRDQHITIDGKVSVNIGRMGSKEKEAYKKLTTLAAEIQKQSIDTAKSTTNNRIPCPICNTKVLTQPASVAAKVSSAQAAALMTEMNTGWKHLVKNFKRIIWFIPDIFKKSKTKDFHQKTKSCGSPDCINGTVPDLKLSLDAYNKKSTDLIETNKSQIEKLQTELGQGTGGLTLMTKGVCFVSSGLEKNTSQTVYEQGHQVQPTGFTKTEKGHALTSKGSPKRTVQVGAVRLTEGDMYLNSSEKFTVNAGAPGISLESNGPLHSKTSTVEIRATEGEAHFSSGNTTVVSGSMVIIQGGDRSGDTGIKLDSDNTHVRGGLSVQGNLSLKGGLSMDGPLTAPYLNVPTFSQPVTLSKSPQEVSGHSSWYPMNIVLNTIQETYDNVQRDVPEPLRILRVDVMTEYFKKWYSEVMGTIPLELTITGWCLVTTWGTMFGGCSYGGAVWTQGFSYGTTAGFCPVWNHPHNHGLYNGIHSGEVSSPLMMGYDLMEGATAAGSYPSHIPIPAPTKTGLGTRPGPHSMPGPCGGGGLFSKERNLEYGADGDDAFKGLNFVDRGYGQNGGLHQWKTPDYSFYSFGIKPLSGTGGEGLNDKDCT